MSDQVVVLGSGYAGAGAIKRLEAELDGAAEITWVSDVDYHLVLHESHRCIRDPSVQDHITIPIDEIKSPGTEFVHARVTDIDTEAREVALSPVADGPDTDERTDGEDSTLETLSYDYLLVGIGTRTAYFGIEGMETHAHTLKSLDDALAIHEDLADVATTATQTDPAQVLIGGAGLTGIQIAGEVAEYRDATDAPLEISLIEGLDEIFPGNDPAVQDALRSRLEARDVDIRTGEFISEVDATSVTIGETTELDYDVLVWAGGIAGQDSVRDTDIAKDERNFRLRADRTFQTSAGRVFAIGDAALIEQGDDDVAPPTAQAAWQAADVAGLNLARAVNDEPLKEWTFDDKGTVISVGEDAVAHDVSVVPFVSTFGGPMARTLKKGIAARWIRDLVGTRAAIGAWSDM